MERIAEAQELLFLEQRSFIIQHTLIAIRLSAVQQLMTLMFVQVFVHNLPCLMEAVVGRQIDESTVHVLVIFFRQ